MRGPGQSYSDVILRLASEAKPRGLVGERKAFFAQNCCLRLESKTRSKTGEYERIFALPLEAVLCQTRCEGLSVGDFRHFQRRREALERRREDRVGFGGAAGRLVEFGERERRAQFEAARPLLFRDSDRDRERFLGSRRIGGIALHQHFTAGTM